LLLAMLLIGAHATASAQVQRIPRPELLPRIITTRLTAVASRPGNCKKLAFTIKNTGTLSSSPFTVEIQEVFYKPKPVDMPQEVDEDRTKVLKTISIDSLVAGKSSSFEESKDSLKDLELPNVHIRIFIKSKSGESAKKDRSVTVEKACIK